MDACTIISSNFLPFARVMVKSFLRYHPDSRFFVLILDKPKDVDFTNESWETVFAEDLGMDQDLDSLRMLYDAYEMSMSLRPALVLHLMRKKNAKSVVFLDSDLYFLGKLEGAKELLEKHAISLCVSIRKPLPEDGCRPQDDDFILAGSLNGGFVLFRTCEETERTLEWLDRKLRKHGFYRPYEGYFGDQKWLDLLPSFCETLGIVKNPAWNASYWNLHERPLSKKGDTYFADGQPVVFFHFSGFRPNEPDVLSVHQNRYTMRDQPVFAMLADTYRDALKEEGHDTWSKRSYGYDLFEDDVMISRMIRRAYEELGGAKRFAYPHAVNATSFRSWIQIPSHPGSPVTNLHLSIWRMSLEAQGRFPDPSGKDAASFANWMLKERRRELSLDPFFTKSLTTLSFFPRRSARIWIKHIVQLRHIFGPYQVFCRIVKKMIGRELYDKMKPRRHHGFGSSYFRLHRTDLRPQGLTVVSAVTAENGIAEGARGLVRACVHATIPTEHIDSRTAPGRQSFISPLRRKIWYDTTVLIGGADEIGEIVQRTEFIIGPNQKIIAYLPWESQLLDETCVKGLNAFDEVWTPSTFARDILEKHLVTPIKVLPHVIDVSSAQLPEIKSFELKIGVFTCVFVFDFYSYVQRKNPSGVLESFTKAFGHDASAQLLIIGAHGDDFPMERKAMEEEVGRHPNVFFEKSWLPRSAILGIIQRADCYVSLHRSESFGLTIAEAIALGTPTVATDFGGCTDFLIPETGWPIPYSPLTLNTDLGPYQKGTVWANADTDVAADALRAIRSNDPETKKRAANGAAFMKKNFSPEAIGVRIQELLAR